MLALNLRICVALAIGGLVTHVAALPAPLDASVPRTLPGERMWNDKHGLEVWLINFSVRAEGDNQLSPESNYRRAEGDSHISAESNYRRAEGDNHLSPESNYIRAQEDSQLSPEADYR